MGVVNSAILPPQQRRFTRLTNGFSKTFLNHCAAVALYVAHYNLCRVHESLRVTPAIFGAGSRIENKRIRKNPRPAALPPIR